MTITERKQMIINFLPLANSIASKEKGKLPKFIDLEELKSVAYLGLVDAANKFDEEKSPSFAAYAKIRIFYHFYVFNTVPLITI
jgi:RNA polymerase sigma factor for flagellar operon FliA